MVSYCTNKGLQTWYITVLRPTDMKLYCTMAYNETKLEKKNYVIAFIYF